MDFNTILSNLKSMAALAAPLSPALTALGVPNVAGVVNTVGGILEIAETIQKAIADGSFIATATDSQQAELQEFIAKLQVENDALASQVSAS